MRSWVLLLLLTAACRDSAYRAAAQRDTIPAYRDFLRTHARSEEAETARARLAELEFAEAGKLHTVVAYKRYLSEFPDSASVDAAKERLEALRFNAAQAQGTSRGWWQFLREHPDGRQREQAERALGEAELKEAAQSVDPEELARIATTHAEDPRSATASRRLDDQAFGSASEAGSSRLFAYLRDFPAGTHREQAQVELLSRKLEGLLFSGLLDQAKAEIARSPLAAQVPQLAPRVAQAERWQGVLRSREPLAQAAQAQNYLRSLEDLRQALNAPDPLERWQAAEELGQHVSVAALDPLLGAVRSARNLRVRTRALQSLEAVLSALPPRVVDYELAVRLEALRAGAEEPTLTLAVVDDLAGNLAWAASDYGKVFDPQDPDPLVLWRWAHLRRAHGRLFSAAVAARQLSNWARGVAEERGADSGPALTPARTLCAADEAATFAEGLLAEARKAQTEFPEDIEAFFARAADTARLTHARLRDAELALLTENSRAKGCADQSIASRLAEGERARLEALKAISRKAPALAQTLLAVASERDPAPQVRAEAAALRALPAQAQPKNK